MLTKKEKSFKEKFEEKYKVNPTTKCWIWTGATTAFGHGIFSRTTAHRIAWELYNNNIPKGLCVLHRCDVPSCVNPEHLFLGTHADNMQDKVNKGRGGRKKEEGDQFLTFTVQPKVKARLKMLAIKRKTKNGLMGICRELIDNFLKEGK